MNRGVPRPRFHCNFSVFRFPQTNVNVKPVSFRSFFVQMGQLRAHLNPLDALVTTLKHVLCQIESKISRCLLTGTSLILPSLQSYTHALEM